MLEKIKYILTNNNRYYVLGIYNTNNVLEYQLLQILFQKDELKIERRYTSKTIDDVFKEFPKGYPVVLHLEGSNIINKVVENKVGYKKNIIFKANPDDFYFFEYHQNNQIFISVIRKHIVKEYIALLKAHKLYTVNISFGPFVMSNLIPIAKENNYTSVSSSNYELHFYGDAIQSFENDVVNVKEFVFGKDKLSQKELPLVAALLNHKYPNERIDFDIDFLEDNKSEFKFKKWFKIAGVFTLVFILSTLFVSHVLLNMYLKTLAEKESTYAISQQTLLKIDQLSEEKILKEKILQTSGANLKSFISQYVVDIGNSVPDNITLKTLNTIPVIKKIKPSEKIKFNFSIVHIAGEATNDAAFNNWIKHLKTYKWVDKVDIVDYIQESKYINAFVIKIKI